MPEQVVMKTDLQNAAGHMSAEQLHYAPIDQRARCYNNQAYRLVQTKTGNN